MRENRTSGSVREGASGNGCSYRERVEMTSVVLCPEDFDSGDAGLGGEPRPPRFFIPGTGGFFPIPPVDFPNRNSDLPSRRPGKRYRATSGYLRTEGVSTGNPFARDMRYSSNAVYTGEPALYGSDRIFLLQPRKRRCREPSFCHFRR
uniref:Uncharacterized protein n=1 Tax=Candidatus Kentrum sp. LFY TaxID=2126342 RepID=A0A450UCY7_9GAMM|nr:MAG: hypothetical protein BECKLFY1418B_GA0070995_10194 [Candidatus Kentron sp. LFY]